MWGVRKDHQLRRRVLESRPKPQVTSGVKSSFRGLNSRLSLKAAQVKKTRRATNQLWACVQISEKVSNRREAMCEMISEEQLASVLCFRSSLALIGRLSLWKSPYVTSPPRRETPPPALQVLHCSLIKLKVSPDLNIHHPEPKRESKTGDFPPLGNTFFVFSCFLKTICNYLNEPPSFSHTHTHHLFKNQSQASQIQLFSLLGDLIS